MDAKSPDEEEEKDVDEEEEEEGVDIVVDHLFLSFFSVCPESWSCVIPALGDVQVRGHFDGNCSALSSATVS